MEKPNLLWNTKISCLLEGYPYIKDFFDTNGLPLFNLHNTVKEYISNMDPVFMEDIGVNKDELFKRFAAFMERMESIKQGMSFSVEKVTIQGGQDKTGNLEDLELDLSIGEIICIVGPTGSGKSRLLADIEWMAQRDTPTKRQILINGQVPPKEWRFSVENKLVAQLSQNMNFVMDLNVHDFIKMHAESRIVDKMEERIQEIISHANQLSGEKFDLTTPLTSLSGGQSRALMVADTAFLSTSPIVLIDEIENAGINRKRALELLMKKDKIVLIATHDPILALMGNKRIVIKNGGINKIIKTGEMEKKQLRKLEKLDKIFLQYRESLRNGEILNMSI